jgi:hypothetical protein
MATEEEKAELNRWFEYSPPKGDQAERYTQLRMAGKTFAHVVLDACPPGTDREVALRKIREAVFAAKASIECDAR